MVRIPELFNWRVLVSGRELIEEVRKAPETQFSLEEALAEVRIRSVDD